MGTSHKKGVLGKLRDCFSRKAGKTALLEPAKKTITADQLSNNALKVLRGLRAAGHDAFLVGGGVRDLLLGKKPKDFDIVSDAKPEQVKAIFRNSRIIGRRFRIVHVYFPREIIEVSTFRAAVKDDKADGQPPFAMIRCDNNYGTIEEDVWRRDFTVNALFYHPDDHAIIDFVGGLADLEAGCIRMIGDPVQRFHEDPVRLLRAIRLAAKLNFVIDQETQHALDRLGHLLAQVPAARLVDEVVKLFFGGSALDTFLLLQKLGYLKFLFPSVDALLCDDATGEVHELVRLALVSTDKRFHEQKRLTPAFLLATFLWPVLQSGLQREIESGVRFHIALPLVIGETIRQQSEVCLVTHRMSGMLRAMWTLQFHLEKRRKSRIYSLMGNRYFRAAFDLLALRARAGSVSEELVDWWQIFQDSKHRQREQMLAEL